MTGIVVRELRTGGVVLDTVRYYPTGKARDAAGREFSRRCLTVDSIAGNGRFPFGLHGELRRL